MKTIANVLTAACLAAIAIPATTAHADRKPSGPVPVADATWIPLVPELGDQGPQVQVVFGNLKKKKAPIGLLLKLPAGFTPGPHTHSSDYSGVVIYGELLDAPAGELDTAEKLTAGRRWTEAANHPHDNKCSDKGECLELVYFPKGFDFKPIKP